MKMYIIFAVLLSLFSLSFSGVVEEDVKQILFHLKPKNLDDLSNFRTAIDSFIQKTDEYFNESNITSLYHHLKFENDSNYMAISAYHSWGLGVPQDYRISVLNLHLGVLKDDFLTTLSYTYKSLFGLNVPQTCETNIVNLKSIANTIAKNFSIFERKEGTLSYVNQEAEASENGMIDEIVSNLEEISRSNSKQLNNFIKFYLTSSLSKSRETTYKIFVHLERIYNFTQSVESATFLGFLYIESDGLFPPDYAKAKKYFTLGVSENVPHAFLGLGVIYFYGMGVEIDYKLSFDCFLKANSSGLMEASVYLGISYLAGLGVTPDSKIALNNVMIGANRGFLLALYTLAVMHETGISVFHSCKYASDIYSLIIEHKLLKRYISAAVVDYRNDKRAKALFKLLVFSEIGSPYSLMNAAQIMEANKFYFYPDDVSKKYAFRLWRYASMLGNPKATIKVGDYYFYGIGVEQNYKDAFDNYQTAVILYQNPEAMFNLGYMYEYGFGVDLDYQTAERFYGVVSQIETRTKIFISVILFKVRVKKIRHEILSFIKLLYHSVSLRLFYDIYKEYIKDNETLSIIIFTIITLAVARFHFNRDQLA